jgi:5-methylthioadenosine/S-adenosylhomocysteine deaminase
MDATRSFTLCGAIVVSAPDRLHDPAPMDVGVEDGVIRFVEPAGARPAVGRPIDARGRVVTPGWINGHTHSHEGFYKGRYDNVPLELWMNNVRPLQPIPVTPRQVYLRTLVGAIDALRSGTTTLCDDMNASPVLRPELVEAALQAYEDLGIRALVGITLFDRPFFRALPFVEEEFDPDLLRELDGTRSTPAAEYLAYAEGLARSRHPRQSRVGYLATPSAPQRCTREFLDAVRDLADRHAIPLITHVQETRLQVVTGQLLYGSTMVEYLGRIGFLKPATSVIHGVWLKPQEIEILAGAGASVQHNPQSNFKLGSGLAPVRALLDGGVNVSLGTDGCGSIENASMLKVISQTALVHKLRGGDPSRWVGADEAFHAATRGGAVALGMDDCLGRVAPGCRADLNVWRTDTITFRPLNDALRQLVFNESGSSLDRTFVDGIEVIRDGRLARVDEAALLEEMQAEHAVLEPLIARSEHEVRRLLPSYTRIWKRCQSMPIDPATYAARFEED